MSKVQEYLKKKRMQELGLPKIYVVKSSREGVKKPVERQVEQIIENIGWKGKERVPINRYKLEGDNGPYEVDIPIGEDSNKEDGYGSGFGDLWGWTYFSSFSKTDADEYYEKELERVKNKYKK